LLAHGWSEKDIQKLAGLNLIRVFKAVEQVNYSLVEEAKGEEDHLFSRSTSRIV